MNQNAGISEYPNTRTVIDDLEFIGSPDKSFTYLTTSLPITSNFLNLCGSLTFSFLYLFLFPLLFFTWILPYLGFSFVIEIPPLLIVTRGPWLSSILERMQMRT